MAAVKFAVPRRTTRTMDRKHTRLAPAQDLVEQWLTVQFFISPFQGDGNDLVTDPRGDAPGFLVSAFQAARPPEGQKYFSLGQRPGTVGKSNDTALKGRNKLIRFSGRVVQSARASHWRGTCPRTTGSMRNRRIYVEAAS